MPNNKLLARIHILKKEAGLDDDQYRVLLNGYGVASSKEFNDKQANNFARFLQDYIKRNHPDALNNRHGWGKNKYEYLRGRRGDFADPQQLRMIEAIWRDVARDPGDEALQKFLNRQTGIKNITWLKKTDVKAVLTALKVMKKQKYQNRKPQTKDTK